MLHTLEEHATTSRVTTARVRCRARAWQVVDRRRERNSLQWHLAQHGEAPRLIASPPDDVTALPDTMRMRSRRAALTALRLAARAAAPVWWPQHLGTLPIQPESWQCVPSMAVLSGHHRRLLLADEIGMGKTIAAGVLLHELHARDADAATLVVVPAGLVRQWIDELRAGLGLQARLLDADAFRQESHHPRVVIDASRAGGCWVISLDLLRQPDVPGLLTRTPWTLLVVDEAHLAAPASARHGAVARVATVSERVLLLTGTPTAAGVHGADVLRHLGSRRGERPMMVLRRTSEGLGRPRGRRHVLAVDLAPDHRALLARLERFATRARRERGNDGLLPALVLLRRALSCPGAVARSLARRLDVLGTAGAPRQDALFSEALTDPLDEGDDEALRAPAWHDDEAEREELQALHVMAAGLSPAGRKLRAVARLLRRAREPAIVFTMYVDTLRELRRLITDRNAVVVHGQQPEALRQEAIRAFTSGAADVLLTTDASAEGLNLQARCRLVVHAEVPPSARVWAQRNGRVDRLGQCRRVHTIVMASTARGDRDALARLLESQHASDAWLAPDAAVSCRRTRLAARMLARHAIVDEAVGGRPTAAVLPARRWQRLADRIGWPRIAREVHWGHLQFSGVPLVSHRLPVLVALPHNGPSPVLWTLHAWRHVLPHAVGRAERLARRLIGWRVELGAAVAADAKRESGAPGLFDDTREPAAPSNAAPPAGLEVHFMHGGVLERRT